MRANAQGKLELWQAHELAAVALAHDVDNRGVGIDVETVGVACYEVEDRRKEK